MFFDAFEIVFTCSMISPIVVSFLLMSGIANIYQQSGDCDPIVENVSNSSE